MRALISSWPVPFVNMAATRPTGGGSLPPVRSFHRNHLWKTTVRPLYQSRLRASPLASTPLPFSPPAGLSFGAPAKSLPQTLRLY
jgi:hypothetical protein